MISVTDINKSFRENQVLYNVSTIFERGKTNLIIGQSGSGKTVLLKCIIGLHEADSGEIEYDGKNIYALDTKSRQLLRQEIGMLFQGGALFDSLTVEENIQFPLDMFTNLTKKEKLNRVNFCLDKVHLAEANDLFPAELSGGMQKRVAIARAIVLNPKYLFCDEPNSGLDPVTALVIDRLISEITHEFNITTIVNTHDMNSVLEIGEKIVFIYKGQKQWEGSNKEILSTDDEILNNFIFASEFAKQLRNSASEKNNNASK